MSETAKKILALPGIDDLNPMQQAMAAKKSRKTILLAPTGSGKTLAFAIPALDSIRHAETQAIQVLVIAPSRELVQQIYNVVRPLALPSKTVAIYGGHAFADEVKSLTPAPQIVVATPGRLVDHLQRGTIDISKVGTLVLDEYDKSLQLGFHDQMRRIVRKINHPRQVILTSATPLSEMPDFIDLSDAAVLDFTQANPTHAAEQSDATPVKTQIVDSPDADKLTTLSSLLATVPLPAADSPMPKTIVFANHRESAERIYNHLSKLKMPVALYHGGLDQRQREIALQLLNNGTTPVLVSTDLGARGLDIDSVAFVVHYHLPSAPDTMTHRNGRTGRQGAQGSIYYIVGPQESIPDYINATDRFVPADHPQHAVRANMATIYFPAGRKEKISARDILGFFAANATDIIDPKQIGKINVADHYALAAVPRPSAQALVATLNRLKIKNKALRLSAMY